jgi:hypothetical protein
MHPTAQSSGHHDSIHLARNRFYLPAFFFRAGRALIFFFESISGRAGGLTIPSSARPAGSCPLSQDDYGSVQDNPLYRS